MPEGSFNPNQNIEQEIAALEQALAEKKASLQQQHSAGEIQEIPHEKEILREVVGERISEGHITQGVPIQIQQTDDVSQVLPPPQVEMPSYLSSELHDPVQTLINTAFTLGLDAAIKQAKATNNNALIDAFHDVLADELYKYLVERGKIKEVR